MTRKQSPNILFLLTDDQAPWTLSAERHPNAYTPALDRLAKQGARFCNLYANAAVCSPSRATLMTGRYPSETGVAPDRVLTHIRNDSDHGLAPTIATWPRALGDAGYRTALVGKWHLGHKKEAYHPLRHGYAFFSGWLQGAGISRDPVMMVDGEEKTFPGEYTSDVLAPWQDRDLSIPNPDFPNLDVPRIDRMTREYHASVHSVDRNVARLMDFLDEQGIAENTIVVFTSDQG